MLTYTGQRNLYGQLTNNQQTANLSLGDTIIQLVTRNLVRKLSGNLLKRSATGTTVASTQKYDIPARVKKLRQVTITVGGNAYPVKFVPSEDFWAKLNETTYTSDIPIWARILNGQIYFWPTPASSSNTITYIYDIMQKDLTIADYTTGSIVSIANGAKAVIGTGTSWTSQMAGRWIRITDSDTANTGDGEWYEIASVTDTTHLTLSKNYTGTSIAAGTAAYTIGQVSILPDGYHELPVFRAVQVYYSKIDQNRFAYFKNLADNLEADLIADHGNETTSPVVEEGDEEDIENPNLYITA